jgi:UDP-glucose 4-epimerase
MNHAVAVKDNAFLITGGAGFVGSHLADLLLKKGACRVVVLDPAAEAPNLKHLKSEPRFEFIQGDLAGGAQLKEYLAGIDGVFHMATLPLGPCTENPELAIEVNVAGSNRLFNAAAAAGVKKIVYSSASSVYGDTLEVMDETHPFNCQTVYGITKLCAEYLLRPLASKLSYVILRYMNVYGPRQTGGLIPSVIKKVISGQSPQINGDGSASFDFVHVSDVARCNALAMESAVSGEAFNVGSGEEASVKTITESILEMAGSDLKPQFNLSVNVPMFRRVGNSSKAQAMLGYNPSLKLQDGLKDLVDEELIKTRS